MSRLYTGGSTVTLNIIPNWPLNVTAADPRGNVTVVIPAGSGFARPDNIPVVSVPGGPPAGATPEALLASGPSASIPTPGAGVLGNDVAASLAVPGPLPIGVVTVLAIGEFTS